MNLIHFLRTPLLKSHAAHASNDLCFRSIEELNNQLSNGDQPSADQ